MILENVVIQLMTNDYDYSNHLLTLNLSLWSFDVGQHARHVDAVPVKVLQEDVSVTSG